MSVGLWIGLFVVGFITLTLICNEMILKPMQKNIDDMMTKLHQMVDNQEGFKPSHCLIKYIGVNDVGVGIGMTNQNRSV
jgi:hypothetical protein